VDSHNIIPVWVTSSKMEIGTRTIRYLLKIKYYNFFLRPKIFNLLSEYLIEFPTLTINEIEWKEKNNYNFINWEDIYIKMKKKINFKFF